MRECMAITHMCTDGGGFQPFSYALENKSRIILSITLVAMIILGSAVLLCSASESDAGGGRKYMSQMQMSFKMH